MRACVVWIVHMVAWPMRAWNASPVGRQMCSAKRIASRTGSVAVWSPCELARGTPVLQPGRLLYRPLGAFLRWRACGFAGSRCWRPRMLHNKQLKEIFFTISCSSLTQRSFPKPSTVQASHTGRLLRYDPASGRTSVLAQP